MSITPASAERCVGDDDPLTPLDIAARKVGGYSELARLIGTTPQAINKWKESGAIPPKRVIAVAKASGSSPFDLSPDLYPRDYLASFFVH